MKANAAKKIATQQANGKWSVYTDSGPEVSMADEQLIAFDLLEEAATELANG